MAEATKTAAAAVDPAVEPAANFALISHAASGGRGNGAVRAAAIQRLQQTHGNRATQRLLQRAVATPTPGATAPPQASAASHWIVDDTAPLQAGQLHRSDFLAQLRNALDHLLEGAEDQYAVGPTIVAAERAQAEAQLQRYTRLRDSRALEAAIQADFPTTAQATSGQLYIYIIWDQLQRLPGKPTPTPTPAPPTSTPGPPPGPIPIPVPPPSYFHTETVPPDVLALVNRYSSPDPSPQSVRQRRLEAKVIGPHLLVGLPAQAAFVTQVLDNLPHIDLSGDGSNIAQVAYALVAAASNAHLKEIAAEHDGTRLLMRLITELRAPVQSDYDQAADRILRVAMPEYKHLESEDWGAENTKKIDAALDRERDKQFQEFLRLYPEFRQSKNLQYYRDLINAGVHLQSIKQGQGRIVYDRYEITIKRMPPDQDHPGNVKPPLTPEKYLLEIARDFNKAVGHNSDFDATNQFQREDPGHDPQVGDFYNIWFGTFGINPGPEHTRDGPVMIVEQDAHHFVVETAKTHNVLDHPESGSREWGFTKNADGTVTFYTRAASSTTSANERGISKDAQKAGWSGMMHGIGDEMDRRQGEQIRDSFAYWESP
ncbi:MAG: hypothetical protein M3Z04_08535 [Chloroflexota bacterium]|nr:hypothetical protein [Chloroflexota bacterium]